MINSLPKVIFLDLVDGPSPSERIMNVALVVAAIALIALVVVLILKRKKK